MTRNRILVLAVLAAGPFLFLMGAGSYHLWVTGWTFIAWWPMAASLTLAYLLGWRWTRRKKSLLPNTGVTQSPNYWTDQDKKAWQVVEAKAAAVEVITVEQMGDADRYAKETIGLALDVARIYRPGTHDPIGHLTLPEILACGELVARDLAAKVNKYLPGSHILSVNDWKSARKYADWGQTAWKLTWLARMAYNPLNAGVQFLASQAAGKPLDKIQANVMLWFHTAFLHELGKHLIELNSGRLKVGADRYKEIVQNSDVGTGNADRQNESPAPASPVTVALVGQVKAGKSSLVNAILGEQRAATDVLPVTPDGTTYELNQADAPRLRIIDTAGYGQAGPTEAEFAAALKAAETADLLLLVTPARSAARQGDILLLDRLAKSFAARPQLNPPPVLAVLSQIDQLTPATEWAPPYDWTTGTRPKEANVREAVAAAAEQFGPRVVGGVPVCGAAGKVYGVRDDLLGRMTDHLDAARGAGLLRALHAEATANRGRRVVDQLWSVGAEAVKVLWQAAAK